MTVRLPPPMTRRRHLALLALPPILALVCPLLADVISENTVGGAVLTSGLRSLPPFLMATWGLWGAILARRQRRWREAMVVAFIGLVLMGRPPLFWPSTTDTGAVVISSNVNAYSPHESPAALESALAEQRADVVVVIEKRALQIPGMTRVADNFDDPLPMISHATAVFCRKGYACEAIVTPEFGSATWQMPLGIVRLPTGVCILALHGPPPAPFDAIGIFDYTQRVAEHLTEGRMSKPWGPCQAQDPALIIGDLNGVPGSAPYEMLVGRGMGDLLKGSGVWGASWPAGGGWPPLPFFRLDHVLAGALDVGHLTHLSMPGADHRAIKMVISPAAQTGD